MKNYKNIQCQYIYDMKLWKGPNTCRYQTSIEFFKNCVKDETKTQGKEYVDLARLITWAMKEK